MARFSDVITLRKSVSSRNDEGVWSQSNSDTDVFFNRHSVSLQARLQGAAEGLQSIASGEVRTVDYSGEERAVLDGVEYFVEDANNRGDLTLLTLTRRLGNE